jgi:hypothetical protein
MSTTKDIKNTKSLADSLGVLGVLRGSAHAALKFFQNMIADPAVFRVG